MSHHRHQVSLEGIVDFLPPPALSDQQRINASRRFYSIVNHFDNGENPTGGVSYNRPRLIRLTYEYALSNESRDLILQAFFRSLGLALDDEAEVVFGGQEDDIRSNVYGFAEYLMDNFFLPCAFFYFIGCLIFAQYH